MQFLYPAFLLLICAVLAEEAPQKSQGEPQKAFLILPPQLTIQNDTIPKSVQNATESPDNVNDSVMEKLKQIAGSFTGVYYISLPDGNLEKVQFIRAPIEQQDTQESQTQYTDPTIYQQTPNQYRQSSEQPAPGIQQRNQQSNHHLVIGTNKQSNQANQQQYNRYQTQQQFGESRQQQYEQYQRNQFSVQQGQQNSDNKEIETGDPKQVFAQYNRDKSQNVPNSYIASVQFTDVPPVTGPIFAYSSSPLVRIVRYAINNSS